MEGFFAKLTRRRLKRGVFRSHVDPQVAINRFLAETNSTPKALRLDRRSKTRAGRCQAREGSVRVNPLAKQKIGVKKIAKALKRTQVRRVKAAKLGVSLDTRG